MNKTSYQVSDSSIKRYWQLRKPKTIEEIEANERSTARQIFDKWVKIENFSSFTKWEAFKVVALQDYELMCSVIFELRDKTEKLNKLAEAFEIINEINS